MPVTIYEFGYHGRSEEAFVEQVRADSRRVVVDVRYGFIGGARPFSQRRLQAALPGQYRHVRALGNVNYLEREEPIELADPARGVEVILSLVNEGRTPVLICTCRDLRRCHRRIALAEIERARADIRVVPFALPDGEEQGLLFD